MTLAAVDLSNLLYLAGALVAATLVSAAYVLRHRRPRSMEAAINEFSRELRALAPDSEPRQPAATSRPTASRPAGETGPDAGSTARGRTVAGIVNGIETLEGGGFLVRRPFPKASFSDFDPFLLLDEMGRGTATYDGLSLAWATVEHLHNRIGARTLFATH